jgi:hypothetical protein
MSKIPSETKQSFGRLLVYLTTVLTIEGALKYSETLLTFTRAGLEADDKYEGKLKQRMDMSVMKYKQAIKTFEQPNSLFGWKQRVIYDLCFDINYEVMSIAQGEGILVLNEGSFNIDSLHGTDFGG